MCRYGGADTWRPQEPRDAVHEAIAEKEVAARTHYREGRRGIRAALRAEIDGVYARRDEILKGGMAKVGRFCLDLCGVRDVKPCRFTEHLDNPEARIRMEAEARLRTAIERAEKVAAKKRREKEELMGGPLKAAAAAMIADVDGDGDLDIVIDIDGDGDMEVLEQSDDEEGFEFDEEQEYVVVKKASKARKLLTPGVLGW